ncbi:hypothetical protein HMPREF0731_4762 [Pseudoroseomonas cervicalis ATCC 49957]|uniref:Uncharacterized protein n=1 Tax=Pseudoroseomonas cervicalis ATCC 49957 TaxID=525371 RepID=D5RUK0_9PROT|nr:hypothetical protein HMPREF0731_4762 [Pseudoroseomonas cervicalis ATCC 49957]
MFIAPTEQHPPRLEQGRHNRPGTARFRGLFMVFSAGFQLHGGFLLSPS